MSITRLSDMSPTTPGTGVKFGRNGRREAEVAWCDVGDDRVPNRQEPTWSTGTLVADLFELQDNLQPQFVSFFESGCPSAARRSAYRCDQHRDWCLAVWEPDRPSPTTSAEWSRKCWSALMTLDAGAIADVISTATQALLQSSGGTIATAVGTAYSNFLDATAVDHLFRSTPTTW